MASGHDAQVTGEKIEVLLDELRSNAGPQVAETAEELVSCLVELYGAGLAEIVTIVGADASGSAGAAPAPASVAQAPGATSPQVRAAGGHEQDLPGTPLPDAAT